MSGDLADARRRAEEALRRVLANAAAIIRLSWSDGATAADCRNLERIKTAAADIAQDHKILRALLAALPEEEDLSPLRESAIGYTALVNQPPAPQPEPGAGGREEESRHTPDGCTTGSGGALCDRCFREIVAAPPPRPAQDAVREAAERLRAHIGVTTGPVLYRGKSGTLHRPSADLPFGECCAELCDEDGITLVGAEVIELALLVLLALDAAKGTK